MGLVKKTWDSRVLLGNIQFRTELHPYTMSPVLFVFFMSPFYTMSPVSLSSSCICSTRAGSPVIAQQVFIE